MDVLGDGYGKMTELSDIVTTMLVILVVSDIYMYGRGDMMEIGVVSKVLTFRLYSRRSH